MPAKVINIHTYQQLHKGDQATFTELYNAYWYALYEVGYAKTGSKAHAQDLVQELFIAVWNNGIPARENASVKEYLFGALRNRILNHYRSTAVLDKYKAVLDASLELLPDITPSISQEAGELYRLIEQEVQQMPPAMQVVYRMSREEGHSAGKIAAALQLSPQTVRNQISSALKRIRAMLSRESTISLLGFLCYQIVTT